MRDFTSDADGVRLATRDYGGSGPALLLIHGGGHNLATWDVLGPRLADEFHAVAYDAVGHGRSDRLPDRPDPELMVDHVDAVATTAAMSEPVLVGLRWVVPPPFAGVIRNRRGLRDCVAHPHVRLPVAADVRFAVDLNGRETAGEDVLAALGE